MDYQIMLEIHHWSGLYRHTLKKNPGVSVSVTLLSWTVTMTSYKYPRKSGEDVSEH